ncbi:MAG: hypothetical protein A2509_09625 [Candidatus Edwardsbacteria bacterium RIFOXYD12_FULL_50_11]|uniref:FlgD/Vpr Ig-like domain-containing protein n=1 Tax=Candidatus Edwardsbacteria bacterium GWF2_54_11 TaxID=1817851 RepID=A0A1F5RD18_9BACT|nr:MAG: hypothetical protein A3K15_09225 [Candidatus Edwardsbacteria bacterium GWE2_54_12]OGF11931.1 MAG: hypothetical protein A2024_02770 [Candidatus Edwardsbacteria bacterium GWF2_54_11]OGF18113.1 MAG: hypothetical protein A2509_09625 [Candidatus Edwardsbacteria bacterium RIFOXYD12_FULL_50_11]OGJ19643.1 MAG: hypothetical protein A2349_10580 [Candidatus Edwardsbacteria bacterium RifOxyB12_full_52_30]
MDDIKYSFEGRPVIGSMLMGHEWSADGANVQSSSPVQWERMLTALNYACIYWRDNLKMPNSIFIMPVDGFESYIKISMNFFLDKIEELGVYDHNFYPYRPETPQEYSINSTDFLSFQDCLSNVVRMNDSCYHYFVNPYTKGKIKANWTAIIQSVEQKDYFNGPVQIRWPTKEELHCQAWLALSRGAKGIKYFSYFSGSGDNYYSGLVDENRVPRSWDEGDPLTADYCIYDWVKELNDTLKVVGPILLNLECSNAFSVNTRYGPANIPATSYIKAVSANDPAYAEYNYFEVATFDDDLTSEKYVMFVNRYCQPEDTVEINVSINYTPLYATDYYLLDVINNQPVTSVLTSGANQNFTLKLLPGRGKLLKIIPYSCQFGMPNYTNFRFVGVNTNLNTPYSKDSVEIIQKYWEYNIVPDTMLLSAPLGHWEYVSTGWQPYSDKLVQYLYNSQENNGNEFEIQFKINGKYYTPKLFAKTYYEDTAPANGGVIINDGQLYTNDTCITVRMFGTDEFSGLSKMRFDESPFGNASGYVNLIRNGDCSSIAGWQLNNAVYEDGYLHLLGENTGPGPVQTGSYAMQVVPDSIIEKYRGKLMRLKDDIFCHNVIVASKRVDVIYADSASPSAKTFVDKSLASIPGALWKSSSDTFTLNVDPLRPLSRLEITYMVNQIEIPPPPPPDDPTVLKSYIPNPMALDNVILEPVRFVIQLPDTAVDPRLDSDEGIIPDDIYDGWKTGISSVIPYVLSTEDGVKRVYGQLKDNAENISFTPGWYGSIVLDRTKPFVGISSPVNMSYVSGTISIVGHANDLNFSRWILDYKKSNSETWTMLAGGVEPIHYKIPQVLDYWNTTTVNDGSYLLRQTGYDRAGNCKAETIYVYVANDVLPREAITADFAVFNSLPVDGTVDAFGNIYATDTQDDKIWKFSPDGDSLLCFGYKYTCTDTLGFNHPKGIAVDESGNIWVTDCYQSKIKKYDGQGNYISAIGQHGNKAGEFNQPTGIVIKDNYIYVTDHLNNRVQVFNKAGAFVRQFGANILKQPAGIAIRQNEDSYLIYVSDSKNNRIAIFDTLGNMVDSLGAGLNLREPWDICFDCNNNLYIADVYNNRIVQLDAWGNKLLTFGAQGKEAGEFKLPQGLAVSPDGKYVYVIDTHNDRIQRFKMYFDLGIDGGPQLAGRRISSVLPVSFMLGQSFPNPSAFNATINYALPKEAMVKLNIYNTLGQKVKSLVNESQMPGYYNVNWDSKDDKGQKAATGVYFYRLEAGEHSATKKMVMIK